MTNKAPSTAIGGRIDCAAEAVRLLPVALVVGISVPELTLGTIIAQLGISDASFPAPVFEGDTIRVESEVIQARPSASRPNAGLVVFEHRAHNQRDELVCRVRRTGLMRRAPSAGPAEGGSS